MQRPPIRLTPPILFGRPTQERISRVDQKLKALDALVLSTDEKRRLEDWADVEFVSATLNLEGLRVARERIVQLDSASIDRRELSESDLSASRLLESLRIVRSQTRAHAKAAILTAELLFELHNLLIRNVVDASRVDERGEGSRNTSNESLSVACRWFGAESFTELHAVEQASIVLLRLLELRPFPEANERVALVGASLHTLRCGLPPIIIRPEMQAAYRSAIDEGFKMNTKPMVELMAEAVERTVSEIIEIAGR